MNPSSIIRKTTDGQRVAPALAARRKARGPIPAKQLADRS